MTRRLYRSMSRPTIGIASADTSMKMVTASDSEERLQPKSSDIGLSTSPKANREPPLKNSTAKPAASMIHRYSTRRNRGSFFAAFCVTL